MQYVHPCPKPIYTKPRKASFVAPSIWDLRRERGNLCEYCHEREAEQRHHCLVGDLKRYHQELTVPENLMIVCSYCHTGICVLDRREVRLIFWAIQCKRYGVDYMQDWLRGLPIKLWQSGRIDRAYLAGEVSVKVKA